MTILCDPKLKSKKLVLLYSLDCLFQALSTLFTVQLWKWRLLSLNMIITGWDWSSCLHVQLHCLLCRGRWCFK